MTFTLQIDKWVKKSAKRMQAVERKIVIDLATAIVVRNPVGNPSLWSSPAPAGYVGGRSRANWQHSTGFSPRVVNTERTDASGVTTIGTVTANVLGTTPGSVHWIANGLPYIRKLEEGFSTQAPGGMVKLAVAQFDGVVREAAASVRNSS